MSDFAAKILPAARRALLPSTLWRAMWLLVAALHGWLALKPLFAAGGAAPMDLLKAALCLAAVGYALAKVWRLATVFDSSPRRAWVFVLTLVLLHALVSPPSGEAGLSHPAGPLTVPIVLLAVPALAAVAILGRRLLGTARRARAPRRPAVFPSPVLDPPALARHWLQRACLFLRPPPAPLAC